jgi:hypothetical protein
MSTKLKPKHSTLLQLSSPGFSEGRRPNTEFSDFRENLKTGNYFLGFLKAKYSTIPLAKLQVSFHVVPKF